MKTIIIYYSKNGNTKTVAETLSRKLCADLLEIKEKEEKTGFLNQISSSFNAFMENKTEIVPKTVDLTDYSTIYIGSPTWAGKPAPAIITLIDRLDLKGRDIFLFATQSSDGKEVAIKRMKEKVKARGGRVIETFTLNSKNKTMKELMNNTEVIIHNLDLKFIK